MKLKMVTLPVTLPIVITGLSQILKLDIYKNIGKGTYSFQRRGF
jgi:hypothetical protein